jgi:iduronate 2-sulfatase
VECSGHRVSEELDGKSILPFRKNSGYNRDKPAISQVHHATNAQGYSIRTNRWRFTEWNGGEAGIELYDHENDPDEIVNLVNNPKYQNIIEELSAKLQPYTK